MEFSSISLQGSQVQFAIKAIGLTYKGTLNPDSNTLSGSVTQEKQTHPLDLERVTDENTWAIPEPMKPMPKDAQPGFDGDVPRKTKNPNAPPALNDAIQQQIG